MAKLRHKYEYYVNPLSAAAKIVRMVGDRKRILELGPGPGAITRLLHANACKVTALEIDPKAIEIVTPFCERVLSCNLNDLAWPELLANVSPFDAVVAGDVLEHLYDPWETLARLAPLLAPDGYVILSVPHAGHNAVIACLLAGRFEYQPWGLLDKTHIRFFAIHDIQRLVSESGYKILEADFVVKRPEQTEFARLWRRLSISQQKALEANRFGNIYQVVLRLAPCSARGKALRLEAIPFSDPSLTRRERLRCFFLSFLSLKTRAKLSVLLQRLGICR